MTNSVIHTLTSYSENEKQNIDQDMLRDMALRFNPEIICVGAVSYTHLDVYKRQAGKHPSFPGRYVYVSAG